MLESTKQIVEIVQHFLLFLRLLVIQVNEQDIRKLRLRSFLKILKSSLEKFDELSLKFS